MLCYAMLCYVLYAADAQRRRSDPSCVQRCPKLLPPCLVAVQYRQLKFFLQRGAELSRDMLAEYKAQQ